MSCYCGTDLIVWAHHSSDLIYSHSLTVCRPTACVCEQVFTFCMMLKIWFLALFLLLFLLGLLFATMITSKSMTSSAHNSSQIRRQITEAVDQIDEWKNKMWWNTFCLWRSIKRQHVRLPDLHSNKLNLCITYETPRLPLLGWFKRPHLHAKSPRRSRLIIDDGPPYGPPDTTDSSSAS